MNLALTVLSSNTKGIESNGVIARLTDACFGEKPGKASQASAQSQGQDKSTPAIAAVVRGLRRHVRAVS